VLAVELVVRWTPHDASGASACLVDGDGLSSGIKGADGQVDSEERLLSTARPGAQASSLCCSSKAALLKHGRNSTEKKKVDTLPRCASKRGLMRVRAARMPSNHVSVEQVGLRV
jgi:hypothetical protein